MRTSCADNSPNAAFHRLQGMYQNRRGGELFTPASGTQLVIGTPPSSIAGKLNLTPEKADAYPFKQAVIPHLDALADSAQPVGAVNTTAMRDGRMTGHNTDMTGFCDSLRDGLPDARLDRGQPVFAVRCRGGRSQGGGP
ncbi:hypothetical protein NZL82_05235 [Sphingomonas sanguinis]|uniref:hypothetical protein n=1 Tax=Sphingomonas sp. LC-1 TaxID=3110957 RepID=UPI0021BBB136|nr:hypothetical protein [Sphingomonas sp. LC-1]MCT8001278.1 hypothetical protein [Sphingomonas sp. LC-1]